MNIIDKQYTYSAKQTGDTLSASEWNDLAQDVNATVNFINSDNFSSGSGSGTDSSVVSVTADATDADKRIITVDGVFVGELTDKGAKGVNVNIAGNNNINIEPRPAAGDGEGKNTPGLANRKGGNIALKPGDDIELWGHKRGTSKSDEVSVKIMTEVPKASDPTKTDEVAAKLQLNTADIVLTSKDKASDSDVMNITVNQDTNTRGYLKVRAQAIDLRSESHGGIALQPKGFDGDNNMNKIKFEHGGGDGLEFGTFNTEKTSLFTDEYRFNKDGVWEMATRTKIASDKADASDATTAYKYVKQADDFYDVIADNSHSVTTELIINATSRFYYPDVTFKYVGTEVPSDGTSETFENYTLSEAADYFEYFINRDLLYEKFIKLLKNLNQLDFQTFMELEFAKENAPKYLVITGSLNNYVFEVSTTVKTRDLGLYGFKDVRLQSPEFYFMSHDSVNPCTLNIQNGKLEDFDTSESVDIYDIIKLVSYMKSNNQGPWAQSNS